MDEQLVRQLVRQALARHPVGTPAAPAAMPAVPAAPVRPSPRAAAPLPAPVSISFARFHLVRPAGETECMIEPSVTCNHCGHCQCYGH